MLRFSAAVRCFNPVRKRCAPCRGVVVVAVLCAASSVATVWSAEKDQPSAVVPVLVKSLRLQPAEIRIGGANRQQQLQVTAESLSGRLFDVTHRCEFAIVDSKVAAIAGTKLTGVADGRSELRVRYGSARLRVPVVVRGYDSYPPVHFENDVIPVFSKLGCNSGGCHGKRSGQNGFGLSVFGFDARADYNALVKEARGRRVFPADPESSLLVTKAIGRVAHGGGRRAATGSGDHLLLSEWIRQGTPWGADNAPRLTGLRVEPAERVVGMRADLQILVTAVYSDGSLKDVSSAAAYTSNAETVAEIDKHGRVLTGTLPGEAAITVNYMGQLGLSRILVPRPHLPTPYPRIPENNRIDGFVWAKLQKMGIVPSELCDDATFLRRLYLDTIGTLPRPKEVRDFLADNRPDKRRRVIAAVLDRDEFADYWALKWADVLLVDRQSLGERGAYEFHHWLREQMSGNRPYDEWVRDLITATGNSGKYGPVNFYRAMRKPDELTRSISQAFLGIRLDCAQCHHHPFEKWAQEDFYGMAGFFNGLQYKKLPGGRELVYHAGYRTTKMPLSGKVVPTRPPGGDVSPDIQDGDPRVRLARWMTAPENAWFARLAANRLWKNFLGRGLVEPEDDLRSTNPATNEPLLAFLAKQVVENKYNLKAVMRQILNSRVYQLSSIPNTTNADDRQNYSHYTVKRLPAEVLLDAICQVTGSREKFPGMPPGTRAIQVWDNRFPSYFLDTFGRSERKTPCECAKSSEPTMSQALHLMNAPEIEAKIADPSGRIAKLFQRQAGQEQIVDELCLAALGRKPSEKERRVAHRLFAQQSPRPAAEDFLWTLLNSYGFLFVR